MALRIERVPLMGDEVAGKRALNGVLNEVLNGWCWRQKKGCQKVPISYVFGVAKNGQKWGSTDSWVDNWVDNLNKQRPL